MRWNYIGFKIFLTPLILVLFQPLLLDSSDMTGNIINPFDSYFLYLQSEDNTLPQCFGIINNVMLLEY